ncbi:MAG: NERD domain-containing protein [Saprospiraceae bacterium]
MAILNPEIEVIKRQKVQPTEGEWTLLQFLLKSLDDTYEIYYQPYLNGDNPDFAIMRKGSGVLIIEVKDWNLSHYYCDEDTKWRLLKDNTLLKSPLNQVENYKANLFQLHLEELYKKSIKNKKNWATVNCAVYFHNATEWELNNFLLGNFQDDSYSGYRRFVSYFGLLGKNSLNSQKLNSLLSKFWLNRKSYFFDETLYNSFHRYLKTPVHQLEEGIEINYTKEQKELIRSEIRPRRKIKGVAGSGKTLVLAKRAVNAHKRTGEKILVLTYNLSLKNYIHDRISDVREEFYWSAFYITNYHQFFKTQANNYNLEITGLSNWQDVDFFEKVKNGIIKFDVVLIDEVQDYQQSWIDIITKYFTHSKTEFVVFGDEKQNIYERDLDENNEPIVRTIPGKWNKSLNTSHRFSSNIGNIAIKFQKEIFGQKYNADEVKFISQLDFVQRIIEYHYFHSYTAEKLFRKIYNVLERNKIHSSDTGILCSKVELLRAIDLSIRTIKNEKTTTTFESQEEYETIKNNSREIEKLRRIKKNHFWMKTGTVKLSTVHSFKGWEIDTLFLFIEKEEKDKEFTNAELIYTALTRARRNLIIFNLNNIEYDNFFKSEIPNSFEHE